MAINLFLSILEISISVGLIVLVLILLSPFLNKRYAAKWKYWIWLFLALRLITPVGGTDIRTAADKIIQKVTGTESDAGKEECWLFLQSFLLSRSVGLSMCRRWLTLLKIIWASLD